MTVTDIVLLIVLGLAFFQGWREGFVASLGRFIAAIIAFFVARAGSPIFGAWVGSWLHVGVGIIHLIAFLTIFLVVDQLLSMLIGFITKILRIVTSLPLISFVNRLLGALFGILAGLVLVGSAVYLVLSLQLDSRLVALVNQSIVARYAEHIFYLSLHYIL